MSGIIGNLLKMLVNKKVISFLFYLDIIEYTAIIKFDYSPKTHLFVRR